MSYFSYQNGALHAENTSLTSIAEQFGTPTYVYSKAALTDHFLAYANACTAGGREAAESLVCYSVKSNSNLAVLQLLSQLGSGRQTSATARTTLVFPRCVLFEFFLNISQSFSSSAARA